MQVTQTPNIVLNNLWIDNLSRSKAMKETIEVNISFDTSFEDVELLRLEMEKFVRHQDNSRDFQQDLVIGIGGVGDCDKLTLKVVIKHKSNWHNEAVRATRRSKFMCALALALKKIPIFAPGGSGEPPVGSHENPSYAVAVDDDYAAKAREKAEREADAARLAPHMKHTASSTRKTRSDTSSTAGGGGGDTFVQHVSEKQAVTELTTRPVLEGLDSTYGFDRGDGDGNGRTTDRQRAEGIEQIRADLLQRNSTRGRRKAGETVPAAPLGDGQPGLSVTEYTSGDSASRHSHRAFSYDVVDQHGDSPGTGNPLYRQPASPYVPSPRIAEAANESYVPYQGSQSQFGGRVLTPAAATSGDRLQPLGARARGRSVSDVVEDEDEGQARLNARKQFTK